MEYAKHWIHVGTVAMVAQLVGSLEVLEELVAVFEICKRELSSIAHVA